MRPVRFPTGQRRSLVGSVLAVSVLAVLVALQATAASGSQTATREANAAPAALSAAKAGCSAVKRGGTLVYLALGFVFHPLVIGVPAFTR